MIGFMEVDAVIKMMQSPDEEGPALLRHSAVMRALEVPEVLCRYMAHCNDDTSTDEVPIEGSAPNSCISEHLAIEILRLHRRQPRRSLSRPWRVMSLARTGVQALDWAMSDPWTRFLIGVYYVKSGRSRQEKWESNLALGYNDTPEEDARSFVKNDIKPAFVRLLAGAWILGDEMLSGIVQGMAARWPGKPQALRYEDRYLMNAAVQWAVEAWECETKTSSYREAMRSNLGEASPAESADSTTLGRLVGLLGSMDAYQSDGYMSVWLHNGFHVCYPYGDGDVWAPKYLQWLRALVVAMDAVSARQGLEPGDLPCLSPDDPETRPVVSLRHQMWCDRLRELGGDNYDREDDVLRPIDGDNDGDDDDGDVGV